MSCRDKLPYDTEYALLRVIEQEIDLCRTLESHREELSSRFDFNLADAYSLIQKKGPAFEINYDCID